MSRSRHSACPHSTRKPRTPLHCLPSWNNDILPRSSYALSSEFSGDSGNITPTALNKRNESFSFPVEHCFKRAAQQRLSRYHQAFGVVLVHAEVKRRFLAVTIQSGERPNRFIAAQDNHAGRGLASGSGASLRLGVLQDLGMACTSMRFRSTTSRECSWERSWTTGTLELGNEHF